MKTKIALVSSWYPVAISRYIEAAFRRRDDVEIKTIGPYTGSWIPWNYGMSLRSEYAVEPDVVLGQNPAQLPMPRMGMSYEAEAKLGDWKPDIWIQIDGGFYFANKPTVGKNVFIATDPHVINYSRQRTLADSFFCMQTPYMAAGDKYLPYAHDPAWHGYYDSKEEDEYDVALVGLHYQQRNELIATLKARGLRCYYDLGPAYDELNSIYHKSMMGINWSSLQDLTARVFELLGMRRLAVVNRVPDLARFFTDRDLVIFDNMNDAVEKILYYKDNTTKADDIMQYGYETVQAHSWDTRVEQVLSDKDYLDG